ncbi:MAG: hypothetical protein GPJ54_15390 [Candidatus Heimdallarchaeota archaeon]|nr:hypothetical protein [Candidatus Heimdallarchaeota archaeon]
MEKIKPSDIVLLGVALNILNILFTDTASVHELTPLPRSITTSILLLLVVVSAIPILWNSSTSNQNLLLSGAVILSIAGSILSIFDFTINIIGYRILIDLISILTILSLYQIKTNEGRLYVGMLGVMLIDLQTLLFTNLSVDWFVSLLSALFELLFIGALLFYIYKSKLNDIQFGIIAGLTLISIGLNRLVLERDTPLLIIRTVIEQLLGIREFAIDLFLFELTKDMLFTIHMVEFIILTVVLILNRPSKLFITIIMCGFDLTYPPLVGFRALAIMYYVNRSDEKTNEFHLIKQEKIVVNDSLDKELEALRSDKRQ